MLQASGIATGKSTAYVPHDVPVENAMNIATRRSSAGSATGETASPSSATT